jgi:hypothetical protein
VADSTPQYMFIALFQLAVKTVVSNWTTNIVIFSSLMRKMKKLEDNSMNNGQIKSKSRLFDFANEFLLLLFKLSF